MLNCERPSARRPPRSGKKRSPLNTVQRAIHNTPYPGVAFPVCLIFARSTAQHVIENQYSEPSRHNCAPCLKDAAVDASFQGSDRKPLCCPFDKSSC